ncbi:MAG: lysophospholipid acyltransferase family protein [Planctomycetota bacterium]
MASRRGPLRNWAEYLLAEGTTRLADLLPEGAARRSLRAFAGFSCRLAGKRREHTLERVSCALGVPAGAPRARKVVRGAFDVLIMNVFESSFLERRLARGERTEDIVRVEGAEHLRAALDGSHGVLLCSGHLGAWELIPAVMARMFTPVWTVARELDNPHLERSLTARRLRFARGSIPKQGGGLKLARLMKSGEAVAMLLDQNAGSQGVILPFMGMPSSHHNVAGVLAQRYGALVLPVYLLREQDDRHFRLVVEGAITADPTLSADDAALDVTTRLSASMEAMVRRHPEQWLWLHDRWRHALYVQGVSGPASGLPLVQGTNGP